MQLIHDHIHDWDTALPRVFLRADRGTLAKRRWRATAEDGTDFGFDLEHPLENGDAFHVGPSAVYLIAQTSEPVLEVALGEHSSDAARLGWLVGNLHFPIAIDGGAILVVDDSAIRQLLEREHIAFTAGQRVFTPVRGAHSHSHDH
jgi:urease accessory protein